MRSISTMEVSNCFWRVVLFLLAASVDCSTTRKYADKLLLVSMDGFRWDYLTRYDTPNFDKFAAEGVKAEFLNTSFITKTFPSHYTIVTGLYPESHGITENRMYDPVFNETFTKRNHESKWWDAGEPVWVTAKKQNLKAGTYFWPGSEVMIQGIRPDIWLNYTDSVPYKKRVDDVMDWFVTKGMNFVTLYYPSPDSAGHSFGQNSPEVRDKVQEMDGILGYLVTKLRENNLHDKVNVIMMSDHGMTDVDVVNKVIDLTEHVDMTKIAMVPSYGPVAQILPVQGLENQVVASLSPVQNMKVYLKENIPERFHYKNNRRIMPVVAIAEEGWLITTNRTKQAASTLKGQHGYDNELPSMRPIFLASGPNFKRNLKVNPILNVDIYPLMCELLGLSPAPNNGSLHRVTGFLVGGVSGATQMTPTYVALILCFIVVMDTEIFGMHTFLGYRF